ncbi:MAG: hypothetical protein O3B86_07410, partial [Planctomycetota bacterium]|nr:hypothetical protein [Planctomycetota bacterium]
MTHKLCGVVLQIKIVVAICSVSNCQYSPAPIAKPPPFRPTNYRTSVQTGRKIALIPMSATVDARSICSR